MRQCLTHPDFGYYTSRDPLGSQGDFVTSPEISQMFGELIGVWFYTIWESQGRQQSVNFVEFGPGKGTLLNDALRSFRKLQGDVNVNVVLCEASEVLRHKQHELLSDSELVKGKFWTSKHNYGGEITWVDTEKDVFDVTRDTDTNYIIAHEFFDALPIKQFIKTDNGWRELLVDHNDDTGEFFLTKARAETPSSYLPKTHKRYDSKPEGSVVEISQDLYTYTKDISKIITRNKKGAGAALIVDYGLSYDVPANSLRGIKDHKIVNPFLQPGEVDLSVDVDFQAISNVAESSAPVKSYGPTDQGDWLLSLGIQERTKQLLKLAKERREQEVVYTGYKRLVSKEEGAMGRIYKFMALLPQTIDKPVGFEKMSEY